MAGIHRSSTLPLSEVIPLASLGMAGIHRSSTLCILRDDSVGALGMAGIHRSSTLDRAELAEKQQVGAVLLFRRGEFGRGCLQVRAVFFHKTPPSCRTGGLSQSSTALAQAAG